MSTAKDKKRIAAKVHAAILGYPPSRDLVTSKRRQALPALSRLITGYLEKHESAVISYVGRFVVVTMGLPDVSGDCTGQAFRIDYDRAATVFAGLYFPGTSGLRVLFWEPGRKWEGEFYDAVLDEEHPP